MAQANRKKASGGKKSTASGKRTSSAGRQPKKKTASATDGRLKIEILLLVILAFSILLLLSNFGLGGVVGRAFSSFFFGVFGLLAYVFPVFLFIGCAFLISNRNNPLAVRKAIGASGLFVFACAFMQLLMIGYEKEARMADFFSDSAYDKLGGGLTGGALVKLLGTAFGTVGAYVLIIIALIIFAIIMTQKPLLSAFHEEGSKAYRTARERHQEASRKRRESREKETAPAEGRLKQEKKRRSDARMEELSRSENFEQVTIPDFIIQRNDEPDTEAAVQRSEETMPEPFPADGLLTDESVETRRDEACPPDYTAVDEMNPDAGGANPNEKDQKRNPRSTKAEIDAGIQDIKKEISEQPVKPKPAYRFPSLSLLKKGNGKSSGDSNAHLKETAMKLQQTLHNFGVNVTVTNVSCGPTVTRYELQPEQGVKVSRIVNLSDDIKLNLAAEDIRIEAPIPGKAAVGIEVPNKTNSSVMLRELLESQAFQKHRSKLAFAVGKDIAGQPVVTDIAKMPHLLIAGATGSGKSVCINTLIVSILYKATPDEVKLIMIDPKVVELSIYNGIPHLYIPVVTDPKKAAGALNWAVTEMTDRYNKFAEFNVRDLAGYNARIEQLDGIEEDKRPAKMPQIVIVVDELADLMMVAPGEVEDAICRLAQLARAAGIHLIIATQRPSVNVITGLIKANMPSRIALSVASGVDSRTILDMNGAEKLLGKGDMLFYPQGYQKPARVQGAYVSDDEIMKVVEYLSAHGGEPTYDQAVEDKINNSSSAAAAAASGTDDLDAYFADAGKLIIDKDKASIGMLQRAFKIGFNRAARIMDQLCDAGVVGEEEGTKPRKVLMTIEQFENYLEEI